MYISEVCAEGIFVTFPWWLKNVKSRSKITLFSNERHFEIWLPKKKTIMFFWSKLSKLHKKDPILHVITTFSLKQGKTRTNIVPIPHPLKWRVIRGYRIAPLANEKQYFCADFPLVFFFFFCHRNLPFFFWPQNCSVACLTGYRLVKLVTLRSFCEAEHIHLICYHIIMGVKSHVMWTSKINVRHITNFQFERPLEYFAVNHVNTEHVIPKISATEGFSRNNGHVWPSIFRYISR